jgi:DNA-binding transcriptional LysR family regulator
MSRTLVRLRTATGDPLLVRARRDLVPTPYAEELRDRVRQTATDAVAMLRPAAVTPDLSGLERTFTIRANDGFVQAFGARILGAIKDAAPGVRLRFAPKPDKDVRALREGSTSRLAFSASRDRRCAFRRCSAITSSARCA